MKLTTSDIDALIRMAFQVNNGKANLSFYTTTLHIEKYKNGYRTVLKGTNLSKPEKIYLQTNIEDINQVKEIIELSGELDQIVYRLHGQH